MQLAVTWGKWKMGDGEMADSDVTDEEVMTCLRVRLLQSPSARDEELADFRTFPNLLHTSLPNNIMFRPTLRVSRALSSHAYLPPTPKGPPTVPGAPAGGAALPISPQPEQHPGTTSSPSLTPEQRRLLEEIVRVDHAGELGANWIYRGQKWGSAVRGDGKTVGQVEVSDHFH